MTPQEIQNIFRSRLGLRLGHSMAEYVLHRFQTAGVPAIPVIATDARTGTPLRTSVDLSTLATLPTQSTPNL